MLHAAVCTETELPVAWTVQTAKANESMFAAALIDATRSRGFAAETCAMDKGYDSIFVYDDLEVRDCRPVISLEADLRRQAR